MTTRVGMAWLAALLALVVLAGIGVGIWTAVDTDPQPEDESAGQVEPAEILASPDRYDGQPVTVAARVGRVLSAPGLFVLEAGGEGGLLTVVREDADVDGTVAEGEFLRVTGDVELLDPGLEDEVPADLQVEIPEEFSGQPVLMAHGVALAAQDE